MLPFARPGRSPSVSFVSALAVLVLLGTCLGPTTPGSGAPSASNISPASREQPSDGDLFPPCVNTEEFAPSCGAFQAVYDPIGGYVLAYAICALSSIIFTSCTWKYSGGSWTNITPVSGPRPPALLDESFVWDSADRCAVLFGGLIYPGGGPLRTVWEFSGGSWTNLTSSVSPASQNTWSVRAVYDSSDGYVVSVWQNFARPAGTTYTLTFLDGAWTNITGTSNGSGLPLEPAAADAPLDGGALFFGGLNPTTLNTTNDTWLFSHGSWHDLAPPIAPVPRTGASVVYDSLDRYDLLVGGQSGSCRSLSCPLLTDEWTFAHGRWTNITSRLQGYPPLETGGVLVTDVADGYVVEALGVVGFDNSTGLQLPQLTLYTYVNGIWTEDLQPAPPAVSWFYLGLLSAVGAAALAGAVYRVRRRDHDEDKPTPEGRPPESG
jgi:hypothetical protein